MLANIWRGILRLVPAAAASGVVEKPALALVIVYFIWSALSKAYSIWKWTVDNSKYLYDFAILALSVSLSVVVSGYCQKNPGPCIDTFDTLGNYTSAVIDYLVMDLPQDMAESSDALDGIPVPIS